MRLIEIILKAQPAKLIRYFWRGAAIAQSLKI
jgi:hypothetical protein